MKKRRLQQDLDWPMMVIPISIITIISIVFSSWPKDSQQVLSLCRAWINHHLTSYFLWIAILCFVAPLIIACSKLGGIRLGNTSRPQYSNLKWGTMIFTSTMSADVIFYSLCEWTMYANDPLIQSTPGGYQKWALAYSLFHWGPLAWGFYITLAIAFGYMLYVRQEEQQKFSTACRPLLRSHTNTLVGKTINLLAIIALIAGTATTFSMSMPLLSAAVSHIFGLSDGKWLSIVMLLLVMFTYTTTILFGMNGISKLATTCSYFFIGLILYFFIFGGQQGFILNHGAKSFMTMLTHFSQMATVTHPAIRNQFVHHWTVYYWCYWMVWCTATPFFIGKISKGRTIRNVVFGGFCWGLAGTYLAFIVLSGYGLSQQSQGHIHILHQVSVNPSYARSIIKIIENLPFPNIALLLLVVAMVGLYSTVFDSITMVVSSYSYKSLNANAEPDRKIRAFWALMFVILPLALIATGNSVYNIQSVAIIGALPISIIILLILASFLISVRYHNN